jgi:hypothetical protein
MGLTAHRIIAAHRFGQALADLGIIEDINLVRRIVIDAEEGHAVKIYVERYGDERLLKVAQTLDGVEISGVPAADATA